MPLVAIEAIVSIIMQILGWIIKKKLNDEALAAAFKQFSELARSENIKTIIARQNAEKQIKAANDKWDEIERKEREQKNGKTDRKNV